METITHPNSDNCDHRKINCGYRKRVMQPWRPLTGNDIRHPANRVFKTFKDGIGNQGVPDADVRKVGHMIQKRLDIVKIESMSGIYFHAKLMSLDSGFPESVQLNPAPFFAVCIGIAARMQFHGLGFQLGGNSYILFFGIYEEADGDTGFFEWWKHPFSEIFPHFFHIESAFGRQLLPALRHQRDQVCLGGDADFHHLLRSCHFKIEEALHDPLKPVDIVIADVPPILTQVKNDTGGSGLFSHNGCLDRIGDLLSAGISEGCNVIYVN